ncbi:MAG: hypothetical protein IPN75_06770 [Dechloromonas sp.]|uniref:Uncharacterized protein n=1 Tax=Candidatus Dechloromonas phosphorivorans TaxID=2899244 RepID=A0A9D7LLN5_9RHOO|nr:hypothetical protein [Candidatus Dechloromonas phosphorivorans]
MLKQRDNVRDFPGRRWLNLSLRTAHLSGIVLLGAGLLGAGNVTAGAWLTLISGLAMFAGDAWANPAHLREVAGFGVLAKLGLVALMVAHPASALPVFWAILVISTLLSHAPGAIRHRRLF